MELPREICMSSAAISIDTRISQECVVPSARSRGNLLQTNELEKLG
jgi:hypothetical protein